nr:putative UDP-N-acetylglucosamine--peptide N-acetylglucosaminyltransferase SEC [Tanacetum cinerariifolium]
MIGERIKENNSWSVNLRLVEKRDTDGREYNLPTVNEVAVIIIGDLDDTGRTRDIIVEETSGKPQSISEFHPSYLPLQYPLLFPYAEDENALSRPTNVWEQTCNELSDDIESLRRRELNMQYLVLDRDTILNIALVKIDQQLKSKGRSLKDIQGMPQADYKNKEDWSNVLIQEELNFKKNEMEVEHASLYSKMTDE